MVSFQQGDILEKFHKGGGWWGGRVFFFFFFFFLFLSLFVCLLTVAHFLFVDFPLWFCFLFSVFSLLFSHFF